MTDQQQQWEQVEMLASPSNAERQQQPAFSCASPEPATARVKRLHHLLKSPTDRLLSPVSRALRAQRHGKPSRRLRKSLTTAAILQLQL